MADNVNDSLKDMGKLIDDADKKVEQLVSDYTQGAKGAIVLLDKVKSKLVEVNNVGLKKIINVKDIEEEAKKIPTVFDRVIEQINQRASQSKDKFAKQLIDANAVGGEAKLAITNAIRELNKFRNPLREVFQGKQENVDVNILSSAARKRFLKQQQELLQSTVITQKDNPQAYAALQRYQQSLLEIIRLQEQLDRTQRKYAANQSAIEGVSRRFNETEQAIAKVRDRWEELNVKRQAGLINEKDFKTNTQNLIDEYDKLIKKRQEFEIKDIGQMSFERERARIEEENRLAAIRRENANSRQRDEINAERMIAQERAKRARETAKADADLNSAVSKQISYQKQLNTLRKEYNTLNAKQNRTSEDNAILEQTKNKIKEIIGLSKQLNNEQKGSHNLAKQITDYDRLRQKIHDANEETKEHKASLESMLPTLRRLASAFGVAFSVQGLVQFGKKLVETRGEFELQQVALRSIIQNKQLADEIWDKTMQAALQSPFTAMQLTRYTKQLSAYRIETDKLFDTTKRLADVSAGLGVDMQRLILAYGQVKAANYLRASEIRQFTEAGVNILGELSDYFARTRGEMVSTAQVMEMVQKRMVKFEDVEAIFKHMTDEGGIFYNMQYVQSQTVKGQINKLHDAYDQMLNSIGQGNQGVLKNMVSIANNLVRNWREVAGTIQGIAWAFVFVQLGKIAIGIHRIGTEAITSGSKVSWLARQLGKLREKSKGYEFGKVFSKANVVLAAGAAVAFVTGKFIQHLNAVRQLNEKYNELSLRAYETQENLSGIQKTLSQNNQSIERLNKVSRKSKEQEEELANARKQNAEIVNKLKREYPALADGMNIQKNGIVTLTSAISDYNEQLEYTILLNQLAKGNTWNDDFQTNVTEMTQSLQSAEQTLASYQALAKSILLQMKNMDFGFREKSQAKGLKKLLEGIIGLEKGDYEGLNKLLRGNSLSGYNRFTQTRSWRTAFQPIHLDEHNINATKKQLERSESVLYDLLKVSIRRDKEYMTEISKEWGGDIDKFIHNNAERIQKNVDDGKKDTFKAIREYGLQMGFAFKGAQDIFNQTLNRGNTSLFGGLGFRFFEYPGVGETGTDPESPEEKQAKIDAAWRRRIQLLEEMKKRYDELSKSAYGYAKSNTTVRKEFEKSWAKIFGKTLSMDAVAFMSTSDMEAAFETLLSKAGAASEAVIEELQKKSDSYGARIPIDVQVRIREDFMREIEKMFSDYELTLDLQKINLPSDAAKDILGFDYTSLNSVLERVRKFRNDLENVVVGKDENGNDIIENHFDKDDQQAYANWMKKVEDQLFNIRKERAKQYTKYLEQELSERAKLEMQYVKDVAFVEANFKGEQKDAIKQNLQTNYEQALKEFEWKSFKESDFYVEMMQDLTSMPSEYLDLMMQKLNEWAAKADVLSPRALKEVLKAREKVMATQVALSPISALGQSLNVIRSFQGGGRTDAEGKKISKNIKESREQMQGIIVAREQEILKIKEKLALEEQLAGKIKAQEELQESLNQLTNKGVEGLQMTADAAQDLANIERASSNYGVRLAGLTAGGGVEQMEGEKDADFQTRKQQYEDEVRELRAIIDLLNQLRERRVAASTAGVDPTKDYSAAKMSSIKRITELREQLTEAEREQTKDQGIMTAGYAAYNEAVHGLAKNIKDVTVKAKEMGNQLYDTLEVLGVETDEVSNAWKEFGNSVSDVITSAIEMIPSLVTGFTSAGVAINTAMGVIGLIALAIQAVLSLLSGLSKIHDARLTREIRKQQEYIEDLRDAYERLEKQIEKTWSSVSYIQTYEQQMQNVRDQIEAMEAQMAAERSKKNSDESAILQYQRDIQNAYDELDELEQKSIEVFGGIGEAGYRSAAEGFVDAWKSAFLETGDGLQGLEDHFNEFMQDWFTKQATMRVAGNMLEPLFRQIDAVVDRYGTGGTDAMLSEIARVREMAAAIFPDLSLALEDIAGMFGVGGEGSLSGLAAGIQGMTEEQANILEAYWNSVRMYTASIDMNVARIAEMLGVGGANTNPLLQQMTLVAANTQATHQLLQSVTKSGHSQGGYGIKVFND